jgi:hypothetical protein
LLHIRTAIPLAILAGCCALHSAFAQETVESNHTAALQIKMLEVAPMIDGNIDAAEWQGAALIDQPFVQHEPEFGMPSSFRTVVRIGQTETALYVAFESHDPEISRLSTARTQRDGRLSRDDSVAVLFDTFADQRTAYLFRTNALATQQDGRIADNGHTVDMRWDATWRSASIRHADRWTVEFEIPLSILKFTTEADGTWGVNFVRTVPRRLETSLWSGPSEAVYRVSGFGELYGLDLQEQEDPFQFIPYLLASLSDGESVGFEAGADLRWRPSSRLGVDLTVNPDFALVEADVETINLSRFELSIPEKRPFFLEGNEMYNQRIRQFYSRRIGDITWGAKASGKLGRTDFSTLVTSEDLAIEDTGVADTANYATLRLQQSLSRGSNIGLLVANRDFQHENSGTVGLDTTLFFTDTLGMTAQVMRVHGPTADGGLAWFLRPSWDTSTSHFHIKYTNLDEGIRDDINTMGFLRDDDRKEFDTNAWHTFWIKEGPVENVDAWINYNRYWSQEGVLRSWRIDAEVDAEFRNGWEIELHHVDEFKLFEKEFRNDRTTLEVGWDGRDGRAFQVFAGKGINYDSDLSLYGFDIRWPIGDRWRFSYELTRLELKPDPDNDSATIHVFDALYALHADLYVKVFLQTNSAIDKENIQLLGVWRFQPPFGSLQLAYQRGTSEQGQESQQGDTFFTKFSWVF